MGIINSKGIVVHLGQKKVCSSNEGSLLWITSKGKRIPYEEEGYATPQHINKILQNCILYILLSDTTRTDQSESGLHEEN